MTVRVAPVVRTATAHDEDRVVGPIVLAFAADPLLRWFYPDPHQYLDAFPQLVRAIGTRALEHGSAHCVESFVAGALWLPPEIRPDGPPIRALLERTIHPERLPGVYAVIEEKGRYHPAEPHWFLHMIGVDPALQRSGYGSALLRYALERIDQDHLPAYLESSNPANISLYRRHGFEVLATVEVAGAPPVSPMLRTAR